MDKQVNPDTPLPYKGMDIRTEIASRVYGDIIRVYFSNSVTPEGFLSVSYHIENIAKVTVQYTDELIKALNKKDEQRTKTK